MKLRDSKPGQIIIDKRGNECIVMSVNTIDERSADNLISFRLKDTKPLKSIPASGPWVYNLKEVKRFFVSPAPETNAEWREDEVQRLSDFFKSCD